MSVATEVAPSQTLQLGTIHQGDCVALMRRIEAGTIDLVFADPPFNIGYQYDTYHDRQDPEEYVAWSRAWISEVHRVLKPSGTFWLAIGDEYAAELKVAAEHQIGFTTRSWVVWYYTFGVNCTKKFSRSHVHLFHFVKDENEFTFNSEDPVVRVPSARALVYADKRANPRGRLPDDTWVLRPQDLPEGFQPTEDTWYYARVAGTFKERQGFHGCQMPEQLLGRILRVSSNPGDVVLDPFAGSGTTVAVAKKLGRRWIGCELSEQYVQAGTERMATIYDGDMLDGPADPIASAPATANGRKLNGTAAVPPTLAGDARQDSNPVLAIAASPAKEDVRDAIRRALVGAFYATHDGYSLDWLLAKPALQEAFHAACRDAGLIGGPVDWNRELLRLRKTGTFPKRGRTKKVQLREAELEAFTFAAEIAWRLTSDKFNDYSVDEILCDPTRSAFFDRHAHRFAPGFAPEHYRWAMLRLRKASRHLANEVKRYHFVFAKRDFARFQGWRRLNPSRLAGQPGIYLLQDAARMPLFIGHAHDLGRRLAQHAESPAIARTTASISILAEPDLPGEEYRLAFTLDLVRRYEPRWNVNLLS